MYGNDATHPDDRFRELARILASGILRLHLRLASMPSTEEKPSESGQDCLDVSEETVLIVHTGKRFPRPSEE